VFIEIRSLAGLGLAYPRVVVVMQSLKGRGLL